MKTKKAKIPAFSSSIRSTPALSDFFLITSATNDRQAVAIADEIEHRLKKEFGVMPHSVEGRRQGDWVLLDYVDFVAHVFLTERRAFYDIERLRKSARPLTPAEFDAELKEALAAKTRAAARQVASGSMRKSAQPPLRQRNPPQKPCERKRRRHEENRSQEEVPPDAPKKNGHPCGRPVFVCSRFLEGECALELDQPR